MKTQKEIISYFERRINTLKGMIKRYKVEAKELINEEEARSKRNLAYCFEDTLYTLERILKDIT